MGIAIGPHIMQQRMLKDLSPGRIGNNLMEAN